MLDRMVRAGRLDVDAYEEREDRPLRAYEALGTVVISSVAAGIGSIGLWGLPGLGLGTAIALLSWLVWSVITYALGLAFSHTTVREASYLQLLRAAGYSSSAGVVRIVALIPFLYAFINLVAQVWMLAAMVSATRQVMDFGSTWRAVWVVGIGWLIQVAFLIAVFFLLII